jgi:hypothetical protein
MPETNWSDTEVTLLRQLIAADQSAGAIAGQMVNRSRCAVMGKAKRLGLILSPKNSRGQRPGTSQRARERQGLAQPKKRQRYRSTANANQQAAPALPEPEPIGISFADFRPRVDCAWVLGEVDGANTLYCGCPCKDGYSWCARHYRAVFKCVASS